MGTVSQVELNNSELKELEHVLTLILPIDTALNDKIFADSISDKDFQNLINRGDLYDFGINFLNDQNHPSFDYKRFVNSTVFILLLVSRAIKFQGENFNFLDLVKDLNRRYNNTTTAKQPDKKSLPDEIKNKLEKIGIKFDNGNDDQYFQNYDKSKASNFLNSLLLCEEGCFYWESLENKFQNVYGNRKNAEATAENIFSLICLVNYQFIDKATSTNVDKIEAIKSFLKDFLKSLEASNINGFLPKNKCTQNHLNENFHNRSFSKVYWQLIESLLDKGSLSYQKLNNNWQSIESLLNDPSFVGCLSDALGFTDNKKQTQLSEVKQQYITTLLQKFKANILGKSSSRLVNYEEFFNESIKNIRAIVKAQAEVEEDELEISNKKDESKILELSELKQKVREEIEQDGKENQIIFATACLEICYKLIDGDAISEEEFSSLSSEVGEKSKRFDTLILLTSFLLPDKIQHQLDDNGSFYNKLKQLKETDASSEEVKAFIEENLGELVIACKDILPDLETIITHKLSSKIKEDEFERLSAGILKLWSKLIGVEFDNNIKPTLNQMLFNSLRISFITKENFPFLEDKTDNAKIYLQIRNLVFEHQCKLFVTKVLGLNTNLPFNGCKEYKEVIPSLKEILNLDSFELIRDEELD